MVKIKSFFKKVGLWFKNHAPSKRRLIQIYAALLYNANIKGYITGNIYQGATKNVCVPGLNCYSCPGATGACPLGALQDSLAQTNQRAPYYILGMLAIFGIMLGRTICGFLCPVGLGQELLYKIKSPKLKKSRFTRLLSYFKYILLAVLVISIPLIYYGVPAFCKYVCPAGTFGGAIGLLSNPNNTSFFDMLGYLFTWKFALLVVIIVACIFVYRAFCRFICPLGAIYGFFNRIALLGVKLDKQKCVDCGMCLQTCKMDINRVGDHECINCGECIPVCPTKAISWKGSKLVLAGIDTQAEEAPAKAQPLAAMLSNGGGQSVQSTEQSGGNAAVTVVLPEKTEEQLEREREEREERIRAAEAKIKKRSFWLQFTAWALALTVLIGALVFYNFFDTSGKAPDKVYLVGDTCPDYTFGTVYDTAGAYKDGELMQSFSLSDYRGQAVVLNFWYTNCDPCVEEIPDFNAVKQEYGDKVTMIIVHSNNGIPAALVQEKIEEVGKGKEDWSGYDLIFTHDTAELNCIKSLDGGATFPMTLIIDGDGVITFSMKGSLSTVSSEKRRELLRRELQKIID